MMRGDDSAQQQMSDADARTEKVAGSEEPEDLDAEYLNEDEDVVKRVETGATDRQYNLWLSRLSVKGMSSDRADGLVKLGEEDPRRPVNWTFKKKIWHTMSFGITTLTVQFGASVMSPGIPQIASEFHVGTEVSALAFSIYVLGNMVGPAIFAPLSEVFGRKIGVFVPCFICGIVLIICANVTSIAALTVFRFFAGVFGAAPVVSSGGAMADMWRANQRAAALVLYAANIVAGAAAAPVIGALLVTTGSYGWRWCCWLGGLLCIVISATNLVALSETFWPVVEQRIVHKHKLQTGFWALHVDHDKWNLTLDEFVRVHFARPVYLLRTPIVFLMVLYASFIYGLLFLLITDAGTEFRNVHHFSYAASYVPLFGLFAGYLVGGALNVVSSRRYAKIAERIKGKPEPEERLVTMMLFAWFLPCGMFLFGWTMKPEIHWFLPCLGLGFVGAGLAVVFQGCLVYLTDVYTKYAASAIAANTIVRSIAGGVFPLFASQMFKGMNVHWASSLLGFIGLALCPVPWVFYMLGKRIRQNDPFQHKLAM